MNGPPKTPAILAAMVMKKLPVEKGKIKVKRHHFFHGFIWIIGILMPPIAVLIRFGVCLDLFINILLTIAGYIPGHVHNWYLQNVRDNTHKGRSPKWAVRYGLVEDKKKAIKESRGWASRYGERNPHNPYDDPERPAEDEHGNPVHESNWEHNHIHGSLARPAAPMPSDSELFEPQSARSLDRPQPVGADDSDEEFFGPDQGRGEAPGSGEAMRRQQTGGAAGASAKMKKMVTGGNSKQGKRMQQQGRERFERGEVHGYGDFDEPRSSRRRADGEEQFGSAYENTASKASSRDAVEISPDTLHHNF